MKLHNISSTIRAIMDEVTEDGELSERAIDQLAMLDAQFASKIESVAAVVTEYNATSDAIANEIKRLQSRKRVADNNVERLKDYARSAMMEAGESKIEGVKFTVTLGKPPVSCAVTGDVPEQYQRVTVAPDKTAITKALKAGEEVQGAALVEGRSRIIIK